MSDGGYPTLLLTEWVKSFEVLAYLEHVFLKADVLSITILVEPRFF